MTKREDVIEVAVNKAGFEYDIHSLVKAFYPAFDVKVSVIPEGKESGLDGPDLDMKFTEEAVFLSPAQRERETASFGVQEELEQEKQAEELEVQAEEQEGQTQTVEQEKEVAEQEGQAQTAKQERQAEEKARKEQAKEQEKQETEQNGQMIEQEKRKIFSADLSDRPDRPEVKNRIKKLIYKALSERTGKRLPWGTLTGIRPVKIPMGMLEEGKVEEEILRYMRETYFISDEKASLSLQIAEREKALLDTLHCENGYSLYIGIPFCPTTCLYCSFTSYPIVSWKKKIGAYLDALDKEIDFTAETFKEKMLDTLYIGGGTPTTLEPEQLHRLLAKIQASFDLSHLKEFTVEAGRADSITPEKLQVLKKYGVTRISVNPQTMKQETLDLIGRKHTVEQVREAFAMAREAGFSNINMDIILGLPGEGPEDVRGTMEEIAKLAPDSLTVHSLAVKRASKLSQWIAENGISALNNTEETMRITAQGAQRMGMEPYYLYRQKNMSGNFENVGYAREGCFGIYNILIMEEKQDIVALGAGSISKRLFPCGKIERCENVKELAQYMERIEEMIGRKRALFGE
ncbi:MAG: coproporphyrinogen dehydrogenase HemZ [Clostridium sp.]|nr:coproporphyrinogen dehydrogenase HemZ [Clostridium sp.]